MAQHTRVVRVREAISEAEIGLLFAAAERHVKDHSDEGLGGPSDVADKLYLHHRHIPTELLPLVAKIEQVQLRVLTSLTTFSVLTQIVSRLPTRVLRRSGVRTWKIGGYLQTPNSLLRGL